MDVTLPPATKALSSHSTKTSGCPQCEVEKRLAIESARQWGFDIYSIVPVCAVIGYYFLYLNAPYLEIYARSIPLGYFSGKFGEAFWGLMEERKLQSRKCTHHNHIPDNKGI